MSNSTRAKLLEAGEREMLSRGYSATSIDDICHRAGVSKGSFYHLFPSKEALGLALLDAFVERNAKVVFQAAPTASDPRARAAALANHLVASAGTLWGGGCLLGSFALELADANPAIAAAVAEKFRQLSAALAEGFAPLTGSGKPDDGNALAEEFLVTVEGALVLARAHHDWSYVERALERFQKSVGIWEQP